MANLADTEVITDGGGGVYRNPRTGATYKKVVVQKNHNGYYYIFGPDEKYYKITTKEYKSVVNASSVAEKDKAKSKILKRVTGKKYEVSSDGLAKISSSSSSSSTSKNTPSSKKTSITVDGKKYKSANAYLDYLVERVQVKYNQIFGAESHIQGDAAFRDIDKTIEDLNTCVKNLDSIREKYPKVLLADGKELVTSKIDDVSQYISFYKVGGKTRYGAILNLKHAAKKVAVSYYVKEETDCDRFKVYVNNKINSAKNELAKAKVKNAASLLAKFKVNVGYYLDDAKERKALATKNKNKINTKINDETGYTALKSLIY